ncbi:MAG: hypothetical protein M1831_000297 [Alyxoria varia]|nr:MAG: hypothetical protein M1831_000297 [Alyxoria varia]
MLSRGAPRSRSDLRAEHLELPRHILAQQERILFQESAISTSSAAQAKEMRANMPSYRSSPYPFPSSSPICATPLHTSFGQVPSFEEHNYPSPKSEYPENPTSDSARSGPRRQYSMPMPAFTYPFSSRVPSFPPTLEEDVGPEQASPSQTDQQGNARQSLEGPKISSIPVPFATNHAHRNSASTTASDSTASSPTNASLADSTSNNDTPATSPDTPASSQSLSSPSLASQIQSGKVDTLRQPAPKELPKPAAPSKRARNLKNLAVDTSGAMAYGKPAATATLPLHHSQELNSQNPPKSPGFVKPTKPPPRKGSALGLSLVTPATDSPPAPLAASTVPPTPSLIRPNALRHFPSSPSLPLMSPREPPEGGMRLPPLASSRKISVGFAEAPSEHDEDADPANPDAPQSRASTYLDGPICIYDPHVYLYYEPSPEQASSFDVILNVANEVKNPYTGQAAVEGNAAAALRRASDCLLEDTESAQDSLPPTEEQTPKASPDTKGASTPRPEYIHVPWEHNTDIVPDLYDLVKVIDERVQCGKKILIHCQCGVSRSASLIVAYGLYKNPSITVQEAYDAVKRRSKWINPNMSLIMQLQEFRSELLKSSAGMPLRYPPQKAKSNITFTGPSLAPTRLRNQNVTGAGEDRPHSAPLPPEKEEKARDASEPSTDRKPTPVSPGPSSAPSGYAWPKDTDGQGGSKENCAPKEAIVEAPKQTNPAGSLAHSKSESQMAPSNQSSNHEHRRPAALRLPDSHVTRIEPQSTGSITGMMSMSNTGNMSPAPANPPTPDETFGLTSPRPIGLDGNPSLKVPAPLTTIVESPVQSSRNSTADTLMSPRSQEFAMTSVNPPSQDDGFGLTSPRPTTFSDTVPHRLAPPSNSMSRAFSALFPPDQLSNSQTQSSAGERAKLRSRLGMSTSSSYDMRSEYVRGGKAGKAQHITIPPLGIPGAFPESPTEDDTLLSPRATEFTKNPFASSFATPEPADTLMSPRATEFTANPFHSATTPLPISPKISEASETSEGAHSGDGGSGQITPKADVVDPRSPAQKGVSPIVRNIFDVFS